MSICKQTAIDMRKKKMSSGGEVDVKEDTMSHAKMIAQMIHDKAKKMADGGMVSKEDEALELNHPTSLISEEEDEKGDMFSADEKEEDSPDKKKRSRLSAALSARK